MKFNIKNWQDKHLITESRLKEIDFKDKAAFDKYNSQHKMKSTTKVNVGGKDTTAGEAGGEVDSKSGVMDPTTKRTAFIKKNRDAVVSHVEELLDDMGTSEVAMEYLGWSEEEAEDADGTVRWDAANAIADSAELAAEFLDDDDMNDIATADDDNDNDNDDTDEDDDGYGGDDDEDMDSEDILANAKVAYENGLMDKDEWDNTREDYDDDGEYSDEALGSDGYLWANDKAKADHENRSGGGDEYTPPKGLEASIRAKMAKDAAEDAAKGKKESITSKSARIQEARMYKTIQELKGLEKRN